MRNWNTWRMSPFKAAKTCFEPTYEELKQEEEEEDWVVKCNRFEPTYEELKRSMTPVVSSVLSRVLSLPMRNWNSEVFDDITSSELGFEPTYEELKLFWRDTCREAKRRVLSLPMRNWNTSHAILIIPLTLVLSLPMRNWNSKQPLHPAQALLVLSLPMRNWNKGQQSCPKARR